MSANERFPVVGVGASAGGIPALEAFFKELPPNPGVAFVIVTHLSPQRESRLHEVLARYTSMAVTVAGDGMPVRANNVYVMPSNVTLTIVDGVLRTRELDPSKKEFKPIDVFLASLATDQGDYSVATILSGGDGDGTLGAKAVKQAGGLTLAQTPDGSSLKYPGMPQSAIASGFIDIAVPAGEMAARLVDYAKSFDRIDKATKEGVEHRHADLDSLRRDICAVLAAQSGHDFSGYKANTFFRRVKRRMQVRQVHSWKDYIDLLKHDRNEVGSLFRDLLINVTSFFRDEEAFRLLRERVIPELFEGKGANDSVRIWVPGCATGEEAYSIAILIKEFLDGFTAVPKVQIFATDIDEAALGVARAARYPEAVLDTLTPERRRRFFKMEAGSHVLNAGVREMCIFSSHSLIRDPPFSRMDLVSCRNLLIYFGPEIQRQVVPTFHYALKPGGFLFLGSSESIGQHADLFATIDKKHRIFQAREHPARLPRLPALSGVDRSLTFADGVKLGLRDGGHSLRQAVDDRILERHAPPHVVVNTDADVFYYSGGTGKFLDMPQGAPSRQLLTLARKGLRLDLRSALRECVMSQRPVSRQNLAMEDDDEKMLLVDVTIEPMKERNGTEPLYLVVFKSNGKASSQSDAGLSAGHVEGQVELEREIREIRERLQSTIEEYETSLEELKSSNEELVSVNEEVQSSNEELEASKEETQSLNEELSTINAELNGKVEELDRANNDLRNLFESTEIATVFLDRQLVIRTFTPAAAQFFNLRLTDIGRPLTELSSQLDYTNLKDDIRSVFETGAALDQNLARDAAGRHYLVRLIPYRKSGTAIDGVVVTLVDVTQLADAERHKQVLISELNHRVKNILAVVIAIARQALRSAPSLETFEETFLGRLSAMSRAYATLSKEEWRTASLHTLLHEELKPFGTGNFSLSGPDIHLNAQPCLSLAMVAHELATNASKYGAFSKEGGFVDVEWRSEDGHLRLSWRERGGPAVGKPETTGYGFDLLRGEIEYRLGGKLEPDFAPKGFEAQIDIPLK